MASFDAAYWAEQAKKFASQPKATPQPQQQQEELPQQQNAQFDEQDAMDVEVCVSG